MERDEVFVDAVVALFQVKEIFTVGQLCSLDVVRDLADVEITENSGKVGAMRKAIERAKAAEVATRQPATPPSVQRQVGSFCCGFGLILVYV